MRRLLLHTPQWHRAASTIQMPGLSRLGLSASASKAVELVARSEGPARALEELVHSKHVSGDVAQTKCVVQLQLLWTAARSFAATQAAKAEWLRSLRACVRDARRNASSLPRDRREQVKHLLSDCPESPVLSSRGLYLWGGVGRGKSLLMDIFAASFGDIAGAQPVVVRQHYHEFMHSLHLRLHALRQVGAAREAVALAAKEVKRGHATVLCLDEFQVTSIADAVILRSLFEALLANDVIVVTTSNRPPADLYKDGLNHMLYMPPFIQLLEKRIGVHEIDASEDYREIKAQSDVASPKSKPDFQVVSSGTQCELTLAQGTGTADMLSVAWGRKVHCNALKDGSAWFTFDEICGLPVSAEDYMSLITLNNLHTLVVTGVPRFTLEMHNEARRFTNLVDSLYEHQCRLRCSAAAPPELLMADMMSMSCLPTGPQVLSDCSAGMTDVRIAELDLADTRLPQADAYSGVDPTNADTIMGVMSAASASLEESGFASIRCVSRLREMGTEEYHAAHRAKWTLG